ncbi:MAG: alpha/beta hydrolase [Chloroflexi bacterium]|nr:alpha/beta hydrolase [Chloroflexota bacterium]
MNKTTRRILLGAGGVLLAAMLAFILLDRGTAERPSARAAIVRIVTALSNTDPDQTIEQGRETFEMWESLPLPAGFTRTDVEAGGVPAAWLCPQGLAPGDSAILFLHGGGYTSGSIESHKIFAASMAQAAQTCSLLIDYRLAPEHPFPAALDDALAAYRWLLAEGFTNEQILFFGDSAGGGLAAAATIALRDSGDPLPAAVMLVSPWLDLTFSGESYQINAQRDIALSQLTLERSAAAYAGDTPRDDPRVSPMSARRRSITTSLVRTSWSWH